MPAAAPRPPRAPRNAPYGRNGHSAGVYVVSRRVRQTQNKMPRPSPSSTTAAHRANTATLPRQSRAHVANADACSSIPSTSSRSADMVDDVLMADVGDVPPPQANTIIQVQLPPPRRRGRRVKRVPTPKKWQLYASWDDVLPKLHTPLLAHMAHRAPNPYSRCTAPGCAETLRRVTLVEWDGYSEQCYLCCPHNTLAEQLVHRGFFPSSPDAATYAFSIKLLDFYYHLWFQSADSAMAAAAALHGFHADLGFVLMNSKGQMIDEGYRRPLQYAIQWYDILKSQLENKVDNIISEKRRWAEAWTALQTSRTDVSTPGPSPTPPQSPDDLPDPGENAPARHGVDRQAEGEAQPPTAAADTDPPTRAEQTAAAAAAQTRTRCSDYLVSCCPMCFNEAQFGRHVDQGCDFHVGGDANFSQRHNFVAGDCPPFKYQGVYLLSPDRVDAMEAKLEAAGKRPRGQYKGGVPTEDLDACQDSHTAGTSSKEKVKGDRFDDKGVFALICRHGIPLCFMNVTDAGEGQKYMLAGLEWLSEHLPARATVASYYDVGCITDRTRQLYDVLPAGFSERVVFATSAMHSYAHQWTCQIVYSPRMKKGMGLTDGEGVERLWSALRMLIPKLRAVSRRRRLVLLDRQLQRLGRRMRRDLGKWLRRRRKAILEKSQKAAAQLVKSGHTRQYLAKQWDAQRRAELSVRSHPTTRLRKSLEAVLNLQEQADAVDESIKAAESSIAGSSRQTTTAANRCIRKLKASQAELLSEAQSLYATLHIDQEFEEIRGLGLQFTAVLLQAHEAKRTCRLLLQRRFQEWKTLDAAHGGKGLPVGTSIHTRTVSAMKKRTPAIQRALKAYNDLCERLKSLLPVGSAFPLPQPLSTELKHLKDNDQLMQDVYISSNEGPAPAWLVDETVRSGIRAMHALDRCAEEGLRLDREARNLVRWYERERRAVAEACEDRSNWMYLPLLQRERARLELMDMRGCGELVFCGSRETDDVHREEPAGHPNLPLVQPLTPPPTPPRVRRVRFADEHDVRTFEIDHASGDLSDDETDDEELEEMAPAKSRQSGRRRPHRQVIDLCSDDDASSSDGEDDDEPAVSTDAADPAAAGDSDVEIVARPYPAPTVDIPPAPKQNLVLQPNVQTLPRHIHDWPELDALTAAADLTRIPGDIVIERHDVFPRCTVEPHSWERLVGPDTWLNDEIIAAGISTLAREYPARLDTFCAISSFELSCWVDRTSVIDLHRHVRTIAPWKRKAVIVPINEGNLHWVLAVVWPQDGVIEIFDSLARSRRVRPLAMMVYQYFHAITAYARMLDPAVRALPTSWIARPMVTQAPQHNLNDCGVWILCSVAALLEGKRVTALGEQDIPRVRAALAVLIRKYAI